MHGWHVQVLYLKTFIYIDHLVNLLDVIFQRKRLEREVNDSNSVQVLPGSIPSLTNPFLNPD